MMVKESNGEVSASIEETNRVRAELGMKPLAADSVPSKEAEARARGEELAKAAAKEASEDALREKMEDAKRKRLLHQKLSGKSLGEMLEGEEMDSAMGWIEKSRRQEESRKEAKKAAKARKPKGPSAAQVQVRPLRASASPCCCPGGASVVVTLASPENSSAFQSRRRRERMSVTVRACAVAVPTVRRDGCRGVGAGGRARGPQRRRLQGGRVGGADACG